MNGQEFHSAAPWRHERRAHVHAVIDANGQEVVFVGFPYTDLNGQPCGSVVSQGRSEVEVEANARLITAAPNLLRLKALVAEMRDAQNRYFQTKDQNVLRHAKALESQVDKLVAADGSQPTLL